MKESPYRYQEPDIVIISCDKCKKEIISKANYAKSGHIKKWIERNFKINQFTYEVQSKKNPRWKDTEWFIPHSEIKYLCSDCYSEIEAQFISYLQNREGNTKGYSHIKLDIVLNRELFEKINSLRKERKVTMDYLMSEVIHCYFENKVTS